MGMPSKAFGTKKTSAKARVIAREPAPPVRRRVPSTSNRINFTIASGRPVPVEKKKGAARQQPRSTPLGVDSHTEARGRAVRSRHARAMREGRYLGRGLRGHGRVRADSFRPRQALGWMFVARGLEDGSSSKLTRWPSVSCSKVVSRTALRWKNHSCPASSRTNPKPRSFRSALSSRMASRLLRVGTLRHSSRLDSQLVSRLRVSAHAGRLPLHVARPPVAQSGRSAPS